MLHLASLLRRIHFFILYSVALSRPGKIIAHFSESTLNFPELNSRKSPLSEKRPIIRHSKLFICKFSRSASGLQLPYMRKAAHMVSFGAWNTFFREMQVFFKAINIVGTLLTSSMSKSVYIN